ncbi:MAG: hypothetical protein HYX27_06410 [Acidobacteria bacterium]|nr:hypothetical protein [Acidobacteriota bacterium]
MKMRVLTRRQTLATLTGAGAAAYFIPAWNDAVEAADTITCAAATPTVTEGPYWVDEKLFRSDIRTDPSTGVARDGVPLTLTIYVQNLSGTACTPVTGAYVDIWHCDAKRIYSDEATYNPGGGTGNVTTTGQRFLRGYQITDSDGKVTFTTIFPGWYTSRTIHIHMRVRTYNGATVLSNFVSQIFFDETVNNTVLAQSAYSRTSVRDTTNASDNVYSVANNTRMLAAATGSVSAGYAASITVGAAFQTPSVTTPAITSGGVGNAFSGGAGLSTGSWISIFGTNLASAARALASADLVNNTIPTSLGGVSVQINNKPAFVQYVSATQINVLAPNDSSLGSVGVTVTNAAGTSNSVTTTLQSVLPGLATLSGYVRAVRYPDGAIINGTGNAETGYVTSAAVGQGTILSLYGTGFGPSSSTEATGLVFTGAYPATNRVTVTIGGLSADVSFAGLVSPGLYQLNVTVPSNLADGNHAVVATVAGSSSQSGALLKVAASAKLAFRRTGRRPAHNVMAAGTAAG